MRKYTYNYVYDVWKNNFILLENSWKRQKKK